MLASVNYNSKQHTEIRQTETHTHRQTDTDRSSTGRVTHHQADIGPTTWGSRCTWVLNIWWVSWRSFRPPSGTHTYDSLTWRGTTPPYRTRWWCRTTCWSGWRSRQLDTQSTTKHAHHKHTDRQTDRQTDILLVLTRVRAHTDNVSVFLYNLTVTDDATPKSHTSHLAHNYSSTAAKCTKDVKMIWQLSWGNDQPAEPSRFTIAKVVELNSNHNWTLHRYGTSWLSPYFLQWQTFSTGGIYPVTGVMSVKINLQVFCKSGPSTIHSTNWQEITNFIFWKKQAISACTDMPDTATF